MPGLIRTLTPKNLKIRRRFRSKKGKAGTEDEPFKRTPIRRVKSMPLGGGTLCLDNGVTLSASTSNEDFSKFDLRRVETAKTETNSSVGSVRDDLDAFDLSFSSGIEQTARYTSLSDEQLLQELEDAAEWEKQILVARCLTEMERRGLNLPDAKRQASLSKNAQQIQEVINVHMESPAEGGWKKHGLLHGKTRDTMVYHRLNDTNEITMRLETPIEASMVAPLLAVLNETDLYTSWLPSFEKPFKLGVRSTGRLKQISKGSQVAFAKVDMPWPVSNREVIVKNLLSDSIDEMGAIVVRAMSLVAGEDVGDLTIPPVEPGHERIGLDGGMLLRKCPLDHPAMKRYEKKGGTEEPMLLASFTLFVTPSLNLILKNIAGPMWSSLVGFAEDIRDGNTGALHREAIANNPDLYEWVNAMAEQITSKKS